MSVLYIFKMLVQQIRLNSVPACPFMLIGVVLKDVVHLLECATLGLRNGEVSPQTGQHTEDCEEDVCAVSCVLDQRWGDQTLGHVSQMYRLGAVRRGVLTMMKLFSQLEQVDRATPLARREEGKISVTILSAGDRSERQGLRTASPRKYSKSSADHNHQPACLQNSPDGTAQGTGPHEAPKESMYNNRNAALTQP